MNTNNPMDFSSAVHPSGGLTEPLVHGALTTQGGAEIQGSVGTQFTNLEAENVPAALVSGIEAELLFAHATGALSTNGDGVAAVAAGAEPVLKMEAGAAGQNEAAVEQTGNSLVANSVFDDNSNIDSVKNEVEADAKSESKAEAEDEGEGKGEGDEEEKPNREEDKEEVGLGIAARLPKKTRPRKKIDFLAGGFFSDESSSEDIDFKEEGGDDEYDPDAEDEPQKKRGRPRLTEVTGSEPKRKRGRPRKIVDPNAEPTTKPQAGSTPTTELDINGVPKVKRKRGRPRKIRPEEMQPSADGLLPVAVPAEVKPASDGTEEVDLGPILMSNLNEANIDPNLDPSLYSNADASVYSPLGPSPSHVKSSSPSSPIAVNHAPDRSASSNSQGVETTESTSSDFENPQVRRLDRLLDESITAELNEIKTENMDPQSLKSLQSNQESQTLIPMGQESTPVFEGTEETTAASQDSGDETPNEMPTPTKKVGLPRKDIQSETPDTVKRKRGRPKKGEEVNKWNGTVLEVRRSVRRVVVEGKESKEQRRERKKLRKQKKLERQLAKQLGVSKRKEGKELLKDEVDLPSGDSGSDNFSSDSEIYTSSDSDEGSSDESSEGDYQDRSLGSPLKRGRPRGPYKKRKIDEDAGVKLPKVKKTPTERRSKKGRPSRQENVSKQVFSIFKTNDSGSVLGELDKELERPILKNDDLATSRSDNSPSKLITINFDNKGASTFSDIPIVSGIRSPPTGENSREQEKITKFIPLPIPDVDDDGKIKDASYAETYLPGVVIHEDDGSSGRLIDERAFFLEGSEGYFEQHNLRFRPSASSLALNAPNVGFEEFKPFVELGLLVHRKERDSLHEIHKNLYHQFCFELSQGYSLNFFGVGSKTRMIMDFIEEYFVSWYRDVICEEGDQMPPIMIVNGYNPGTKLKGVLHDITATVVAAFVARTSGASEENKSLTKMPKHVSEVFPFLVKHLKRQLSVNQKNRVTKASLVLVIHNIDGDAFRDERSQNILSQLALLPNVWVIVSTDNINLSLLWDLYRFKNFNFLWHDVTTFEPYAIELSFKDMLSMGQSRRFTGSRGAKYVLASLTANAKKLYQVLLLLQMDALRAATSTKAGRTGLKGSSKFSVVLRSVYDKCVEKFIVSNDVNFKTMLGEYVEHKMCVLTKNTAGQEVVYVPFTLDEMQKIQMEEFPE